MCGIAGHINWGGDDVSTRMNRVQAHRGPDDDGTWTHTTDAGGSVSFGSRRLAILDLSPAGHMPMSTPDGRLTLVYNGEVYNYPELRRSLESVGYNFSSGSDTEAVLYLYDKYGPDCVRRLNGMFAFAIWDNRRQQLFLARDHFGIKPLYYCHQNERFGFASEIKALLELPGLKQGMDFTALSQYLSFLWVPDPLTLFQGVYKLPAGHYAVLEGGELRVTRYWDLSFPDSDFKFEGDERELALELRRRFNSTVKAQMLSDVPLGAFLSAGLDSSSIVAAMAEASDQPVRTFTISFPEKHRKGESALDDTAVARRTAEHFGCQHTDILVEPKVADLLPSLVWHMDEPTADPAIITAFLVSREARKQVTVLLSGVGGDELFAGYRKYQAHYLAQHYRRIPAPIRKLLLEPAIASLPSFRGSWLKGPVRLAKKMARSGSLSPADRFIRDSIYLSEDLKNSLYTKDTRGNINGVDARCQHFKYFEQVANADFLNQMLYLDTKAFMVSLNLNYNDKMSMASSVEVRVPFLDWELAEWAAASVPPRLKLHNGTTKHILREAMRPVLPPEVLTQKKAGFGAPVDYWLANDLQETVDDLLSESNVNRRGLFNPQVIDRLVKEHRQGQEDWSMQIWQLLTLEIWMQVFMD